jgi:hypothetical protein
MDEQLKVIDTVIRNRTIISNIITDKKIQEIKDISKNMGFTHIDTVITANEELIMKFVRMERQ